MRNFLKCTKSHEELPNMHKIPPGSSENAQNPMLNSKKAQNLTKNFQKCRKSHEEFQKCTKSHEKLPNMHKIP
jgi:hypothetical protein